MKTKEQIKKWILANCVDSDGDINLSNLDFSDFDGNVWINNMKVGGSLWQAGQNVKGNLRQNFQKVGGSLYQCSQKVKGDLFQDFDTPNPNSTKANKHLKNIKDLPNDNGIHLVVFPHNGEHLDFYNCKNISHMDKILRFNYWDKHTKTENIAIFYDIAGCLEIKN